MSHPGPLREFRDLWQRCAAPSNDRQSTALRSLTHDEAVLAIEDIVSLATKVAAAAASVSPDEPLATLAGLG